MEVWEISYSSDVLLACVVIMYSDSNTFLIMEEVYKAPIPFEEHWGQVTLMKALWYFLQHLVGMVTREGTTFQDMIKKLISKR